MFNFYVGHVQFLQHTRVKMQIRIRNQTNNDCNKIDIVVNR